MLTVVSAVVVCAALAADAEAKPAGPVRHVVLFGFKEGTTDEQTRSIEEAFRALPDRIDVIQDFEWGTDISPEGLSDGHTHAFFLTFADAAARDAYLPHPEHKAFGQVLGPYRDKVTVIDYVPQVVLPAPAAQEGAAAPVRHVVLFKFKDSATPEQVASVEKAFAELPSKIEAIKGLEWGTNVSPEGKSDGFTHAFFLTFADEAGRDAYLPHPAHKEFGKLLGPYLDKVRVVDYQVRH